MWLCQVEPIVHRDHAEINALSFIPSGNRLTFAGGDGDIKIWNGRGNEVQKIAGAHTRPVVSVAFPPDGQYLASVG
jgi:WD40 repeat protein